MVEAVGLGFVVHGMVVLVPYAILVAGEMLDSVLRESIYPVEIRYTISPKQMIDGTGYVEPGWLVLGTLSVLTLGSYALGYWQEKRHELV